MTSHSKREFYTFTFSPLHQYVGLPPCASDGQLFQPIDFTTVIQSDSNFFQPPEELEERVESRSAVSREIAVRRPLKKRLQNRWPDFPNSGLKDGV